MSNFSQLLSNQNQLFTFEYIVLPTAAAYRGFSNSHYLIGGRWPLTSKVNFVDNHC